MAFFANASAPEDVCAIARAVSVAFIGIEQVKSSLRRCAGRRGLAGFLGQSRQLSLSARVAEDGIVASPSEGRPERAPSVLSQESRFAWSPRSLNGSHLHLVHPAAVHGQLGEIGLECAEVRRRQLDLERAEPLPQMLRVARPGDRDDEGLLDKQPGQSKLRRCRVLRRGNGNAKGEPSFGVVETTKRRRYI